jgi:hypothetical protein
MVVHACNPRFSGGSDRRILAQGQSVKRQKNLLVKKTKLKSRGLGGIAQV